MRTLTRFATIVLAAALLAGLTKLYADFQPRSPRLRWETERSRRPSEPHLDHLPNFLGEFVVVGLIAVAGRKLLRLRLTSPSGSR